MAPAAAAETPESAARVMRALARRPGFAGRWRPGGSPREDGPGTPVPRIHLAGEVHGLDALRRQLGLRSDASDVATLASAWQRWGPAAVQRLNGVFALAVEGNAGLALYRDPSSLSSLYFCRCADGSTAFATRVQDVVSQPGVCDRLSDDALHEFLRMGDVAAPRTLYRDILAVEPGRVVDADGNGVELPAALESTDGGQSFEEAVGELERRLLASVALRLDGSRRPGAFLSGGIDSSLLAVQARVAGWSPITWTVGFAGMPVDEGAAAAAVARHLGLAHHVLSFDATAWRAGVQRFAAAADQPTADPASVATMLSFDACREQHDVVLDGTGADESVGHWPPRHIRVAVAIASRIPRHLRRWLGQAVAGLPALARYAPILAFDHAAELSIRWNGFREHEIESLCGKRPDLSGTRFYRAFDRFPRHAHFERESALLDAMPCERLNQALQASPLDLRFPFTDPAVDGYLRGLPVALRASPHQPKRILRAVLARHLPEGLWNRPKNGFDFPLHRFLTADGGAWAERALDPTRWARRGWRGAEVLTGLARDWKAGNERQAFRVYQLVMLDHWLEHHRHSF